MASTSGGGGPAKKCPICDRSFGLFVHRHKCKQCQRDVCSNCLTSMPGLFGASFRSNHCSSCVEAGSKATTPSTPSRAGTAAAAATSTASAPAAGAGGARRPPRPWPPAGAMDKANGTAGGRCAAAPPAAPADSDTRRSKVPPVPPHLLRRDPSVLDAVCTGDTLLLFADPDQVTLSCRGFAHDECEGLPPSQVHLPFQAWTVSAVTNTDSDRADDRMYNFDVDAAPTLENAAAMSPSLQAILSPRVDLELQKMAQWPRLLATRVERRGLRGLFEEELEALMLDTIRRDPNILSMAVAFEPGVFFRAADSTEPEAIYAHFAEWAKPSAVPPAASNKSSPTAARLPADAEPHQQHGKHARTSRHESCPYSGSICYGDVTFAELLPPTYKPLYREWKWYQTPKKSGQASWSDPYLDDGGANVPMVTYSVPIRQDGVFAGVVTMDVVLDPTSTSGLTQAAALGGGDAHEEGAEAAAEAAADAAAEAESRAKLEGMVQGPRRVAKLLTELYDSQGAVDSAIVKNGLKSIVLSDPNVFGSCVAFQEAVFASRARCSFYGCRVADGDSTDGDHVEATAGAGAGAGAGSTSAGADGEVMATTVEEGLRISPLDYDYVTEEWFRVPMEERKEYWSEPYYDDGGGNIWMVTYAVPFRNGAELAGVVTLDIPFTQSLKAVFSPSMSHRLTWLCSSCDLLCTHSYRTVAGSVGRTRLCDRCTADGLLPPGFTASDLRLSTSERYKEWWSRTRRPGTAIRYGQAIQLAHSGTGEFLATRLIQHTRRQSSHLAARDGMYALGLDTGMPDPYVEGSPDSWFRIMPASPGHCLGEVVRWSDEIRLVSRRWEWTATVPRPASSVVYQSEQMVHDLIIRSWRLVDFARWSVSLAAGAVTIPRDRSIPDSTALTRRVFELRDDDGDGSSTVLPSQSVVTSDGEAPNALTPTSRSQPVLCGSPLVVLSLQNGSAMHATRRTELLGNPAGVDAITFGGAGSADETVQEMGITPSSLPSVVRSGDVWVPIFTAGDGGAAKWGTLFHLHHPATGGFLAFPPYAASKSVDAAFVHPVIVYQEDQATPFFMVRAAAPASSGDDSDEDTGDLVHFGVDVRIACRINRRSWWLGLPDDGGRLGARALGRLPLSAHEMAADAAIGRVWLWDQRDAALHCTLRPVARSFLRDIRRSVACVTELTAIVQTTSHTMSTAAASPEQEDEPSPTADMSPPRQHWKQAAKAYRAVHLSRGRTPSGVDQLDTLGMLERSAELLLHLALFLRGQRVDVLTLNKVVDAAIVSSKLAVLPDQPSNAGGSYDWSGLMASSRRNNRVVESRQSLLRDARAIEVVFATLKAMLAALDPDRDPVASHVATRVSALCLRLLQLLVSRSRQSCIVASLQMDLLGQIVGRQGINLPHNSIEMQELSRLAAGVLQELIRRYRPVITQVTTDILDRIMDNALQTTPLPATLVLLLCGLVARPAVSAEVFCADFESLAEEQGVLDSLGSGELVCFNANQWRVITRFLMADSCELLKRFQPGSELWDTMHTRAEAMSTTEGVSVVTDAMTEYGEKSVVDDHRAFAGGARTVSKKLSLGAAESVLRLCNRVCLGAFGAVIRQALTEHAGFTFERLTTLAFDDKYPFRLRAQLSHLTRNMYVSPQLVPPLPPTEGGASYTAAALAGSGPGAASVAAASAVDASSRGVPVSVAQLHQEVVWGMGRVGAAVASDPAQDLPFLASARGFSASVDGDDVVGTPGGALALATGGAGESKAPDTSSVGAASFGSDAEAAAREASDQFRDDLVPPTLSTDEVELSGDCELPHIEHRDSETLFAQAVPYLERCLALRKKHVLTLAVLKLCYAMIARGEWDTGACARLIPQLVAILAEDAAYAATHDDDWAVGFRRLLRAKLQAAAILHLILTQVSHDSTLRLFRAAKADYYNASRAADDGTSTRLVSTRMSRSLLSRQGPSGQLLRRGNSALSNAMFDGCGPQLSAVLRTETDVWKAMHSMFELGEKDDTGLGAPRPCVSLPQAMLLTLVRSDFSPLLRSVSFLLVRLHSGSSEVAVNVSTSCLLHDPTEDAFSRHTHAVVQAVRALTLHERTVQAAEELVPHRLRAIAPTVSRLLGALLFGLRAGSFAGLQDDGTPAPASLRRVSSHTSGVITGAGGVGETKAEADDGVSARSPVAVDTGDAVAPDRAAHIYHTLAVTQLCVELLRIPLQGVAVAVNEHVRRWRSRTGSVPDEEHAVDENPLLHILRATYALLTELARHHPPTRVHLRSHLNFMLSHANFKLSADELVRVLVMDSQEAAASVMPKHITSVISRLQQPDTRRRIQLVQFLKALVCVEDGVLVKRNQMIVLRGLCELSSVLGLLKHLNDHEQLHRFVRIANHDTDRAGRHLGIAHSSSVLPKPVEECSSEASFYVSMLDLLTACCPNKLVYRDGLATREGEEAALLVQAAVPLKGVVSALLSVQNFHMKAVLLRFLEQIWGALALAVTPATNVLDLTPVPRMTSKPATATSPIAIHLVEDFCVSVDLWLGRSASGGPASAPDGEFVTPESLSGLAKYLFETAFPFLVGYFHSAFKRTLVDNKAMIPIADTLFRRLIAVANSLTASGRKADVAHLDALMNCIINLHDPEGCLRCSGVNGGLSDEQVATVVDALRSKSRSAPSTSATSPLMTAWLVTDEVARFPWLTAVLHALDHGATPGQGLPVGLHQRYHQLSTHLPANGGFRSLSYSAASRDHGHGHSTKHHNGQAAHAPASHAAHSCGGGDGASHGVPGDAHGNGHVATLSDLEFEPLVHVVSSSDVMLERLLLLMTEIADASAVRSSASSSGGTESSTVADDALRDGAVGAPAVNSVGDSPQFPTLLTDPADPVSKPEVLMLPFLRVFSRLAVAQDGTINPVGQRTLVHVGAARLIVRLMGWAHRHSNTAVLLQCLELAQSVLDGGYRPAQTALLMEMRSSSDSTFLSALDTVIAQMELHILTNAETEAVLASGSGERYSRQLAASQALKLSLSVMQQLCEGHYTEWQDLLREQPGAIADVDVISNVVNLLARLTCASGSMWYVLVYWTAWYKPESIVTAFTSLVQLFDTLTEVMQGPCEGNQVLLSNSQVLEAVASLWGALQTVYSHRSNTDDFGTWDPLSAGEQDEDAAIEEEQFTQPRGALLLFLQDTILSTLSAMLEGGDGTSAARMTRRLELDRVADILSHILPMAISSKHRPPSKAELTLAMDRARLSDGVWDQPFSEADLCANYVSFLKQLAIGMGMRADLKPEASDFLSPSCRPLAEFLQLPNVQRLVQHFGDHVGQVEVLRNDKLRTIVYRVPPAVTRTRDDADIKQSRARVIFFVKRDNPYAKIDDYVRLTSAKGRRGTLLSELLANPRLKEMALVQVMPVLMFVTFALAVVLNILLLVCESNVTNNGDRRTVLKRGNSGWTLAWSFDTGGALWTCRAVFVLGVLHAVLSLFRLAGFYIQQYPKWKGQDVFAGLQPPADQLSVEDGGNGGAAAAALEAGGDDGIGSSGDPDETTSSVWSSALSLVGKATTQPLAVYMLLYTAASVLGVFEPLLFGFHLFDLVIRSSLLKETLSALRQYGGSLVAAGLLWLLTMYAFALIGDASFSEDFGTECDTLLDCVAFTLNFGMRAGGGLGDVLSGGVDGFDDFGSRKFGRMLFDIAFFTIVNIIMIAIVSGIIIDAFGASRDRRNEVNEDQQTKCFICSQETSKFERLGRGFRYHTKYEHNMWQYVYLVAYLRLKEETALTGLESYIADRIRQHSLDYFPIGRASVSSLRN